MSRRVSISEECHLAKLALAIFILQLPSVLVGSVILYGFAKMVETPVAGVLSASFFLCVSFASIVHELSHAIYAKKAGLRLKSITISTLLPSLAVQTTGADYKTKFFLLASGSFGNLILSFMFAVGAYFSHASLLWLGALINISVALINMLPLGNKGPRTDGKQMLGELQAWKLSLRGSELFRSKR